MKGLSFISAAVPFGLEVCSDYVKNVYNLCAFKAVIFGLPGETVSLCWLIGHN